MKQFLVAAIVLGLNASFCVAQATPEYNFRYRFTLYTTPSKDTGSKNSDSLPFVPLKTRVIITSQKKLTQAELDAIKECLLNRRYPYHIDCHSKEEYQIDFEI